MPPKNADSRPAAVKSPGPPKASSRPVRSAPSAGRRAGSSGGKGVVIASIAVAVLLLGGVVFAVVYRSGDSKDRSPGVVNSQPGDSARPGASAGGTAVATENQGGQPMESGGPPSMAQGGGKRLPVAGGGPGAGDADSSAGADPSQMRQMMAQGGGGPGSQPAMMPPSAQQAMRGSMPPGANPGMMQQQMRGRQGAPQGPAGLNPEEDPAGGAGAGEGAEVAGGPGQMPAGGPGAMRGRGAGGIPGGGPEAQAGQAGQNPTGANKPAPKKRRMSEVLKEKQERRKK